ncbi:basic 7S globulin-like [Chenopodium quinoa]|uniref:basic 7S globulin-like n=1 Tax=Chenopodium quinoa TaxID=63459 RepID=UPI000B78EE0A|nr:basic 7S globulin-like [Chenopodium quinoa]
MASLLNNYHFCTSLYLLLIYFITTTITTTSASASASFRPKALLLRVSKDNSTNQYTTKLIQRTPSISLTLTLDLGTQFLWLNCGKRYVSSTYRPVYCGSPQCTLANTKTKTCRTCPAAPKPGCNKNTCRTLSIHNPITNKSPTLGSELATDVIRVNSTNGATPGQLMTIPNFLFVCAPKSLLHGLAKGVSGVAGFGRTSKVSLPTQFSSSFHFPNIFALCLPPNPLYYGDGVIFLGDGPYIFAPGGTGTTVDLRSKLSYTPLIVNPFRTSEYFIGVKGIKISGKDVPINKSLLSIDSKGYGGTTISLLHPYTIMETSIFKAVTTAFDNQLRDGSFPTKRVAPVAPFEVCYEAGSIPSTRIGPVVPHIDLVLQSEDVLWTLAAPNLVVRTNMNKADCLGIVDGGKKPKSSIIIGGFQIEDNLLQFDLVKSRLGFSSALIYDRIGCSYFNVP